MFWRMVPMIRMLTVRLCVRVWRRAIKISDALSPSTWKLLAVVQALLAVFAFWAYHVMQTKAPGLGSPLAKVVQAPTENPRADLSHFPVVLAAPTSGSPVPTISSYQWTATPSSAQPFSGTITGTNFIVGGSQVWFCVNDSSACHQHNAIITSAGDCVNLTMRNVMLGAGSWQVRADDGPFKYGTPGGAPRSYNSFASFGGWSFPSLPSVRPIIVSPGSNTEGQSLFGTLAPIALLLQGIVSTLNALGAFVFGWIAYHRGKADAYLKQLQIRKTELELEQLEREIAKERREAERSGIIIVTG
jgi:hypothetical protein